MARTLKVEIIGDASSLERAFGKAGKSGSSFGRAIGTASKVAVGALAALGLGAKVGFDELAQGQNVAAQTNAVLKSTGGIAKVTASEIDGLARSLSLKSGVDDEVIASGENMLLTFTKIRNEAGRGNDVFNQATKATLNLSVAMGKDMQSSAILVGKALNDPIAGLSSLTRAGIQFTESQKETIKAMVASGDQMGAQKLILKELETQFGGSAAAAGETMTGGINKARNAFAEMAAGLVEALLPAITSLATKVSSATRFMAEHQGAVKVTVAAIAGLSAVVLVVGGALKAYSAAVVVVRAATVAWTAVQWLLNIALTANPIGVVVMALAAMVAATILAWKNSETFRNVVTGAWNFVKDAVLTAVSMMLGMISKMIGAFAFMVEAAAKIPGIGGKFQGLAESVRGAQARVDGLRGSIDSLRSKDITVKTTILTIHSESWSGGRPGGRARGGPVSAFTPYIVGERGPEMFVPNSSGSIVPNHRLGAGGGGGNVYVTIPNYLGDKRELIETIRSELIRVGRRNPGALGGLA